MPSDDTTRRAGRGRGALQERERLLGLLFDFSQALVAAPDVKGICASAFDVLERILDWRMGVVFLRTDEPEGRLVQVHGRNVPSDLEERIRALPVDETTQSGATAARGEILLTRGADYRYPRFDALVRDLGLGGIVSLPLVTRDRTLGVLTIFLEGDPESSVPAWVRPALGTLARLLAQSLGNARLFDALVHARAETRRANEALGEFTYVVSHDLKEPLRTIQAYCSTLAADFGDTLDEPGTSLVSNIVGSADHLQRLLEDLLQLSAVGRDRGPTVDLDMEALVARAILPFADAAAERDAEIRILRPLPRARGDVGTIETVVLNLVSNALKFNTSRKPLVEIGHAADKRSAGGRPDRPDRRDRHTYFVRDNGIGIAPARHTTVFAPFRQLQPRHAYGGTGAGLAIVRRIVEMHGGRVWVESQEGRGATFYFTLPVASDEPPV